MTKLKFIGMIALAAIAFMFAYAPAAHADGDRIAMAVGKYDVLANDNNAVDLRLEYRWGSPVIWGIKPFAGLEGTTDGAIYGLGGFYGEIFLGDSFFITPSIGAGLYSDGGGKDLGHVIEFRSQLQAGFQFDNMSRISVGFGHISNASIGDRNPGTEILNVYYSIPADWLNW